MAAADYIPNLVEEVLAWQSNVRTQRIPNKHSEDTTEAKLGMRFAKLLLRRSKALGGKPSGRQLEPTEVALVNSVPGVPARGCSVHGWRETEPCDLLLVEETEPQVPDHGGAASGLGCAKATGPLERHPTDKEAAAAGTQNTVTASPPTTRHRRRGHGRSPSLVPWPRRSQRAG